MQIISLRILWACVWISVCISVWSFGYKKLSLLRHAIGRNLWCKAPQFSSAWYVNYFQPKVPGLSQQDTSVKASNKTEMNFSQQANLRRSFSSTELRLLHHNNQVKLLVWAIEPSSARYPDKSFEQKLTSLPQQATRMASLVSQSVRVSTTILHHPQRLYEELPMYGSTAQEPDLQ